MRIIVADPITESDPEIIGIVATTWNCSGVIDMFGIFDLASDRVILAVKQHGFTQNAIFIDPQNAK